jgi:hypothetical protein
VSVALLTIGALLGYFACGVAVAALAVKMGHSVPVPEDDSLAGVAILWPLFLFLMVVIGLCAGLNRAIRFMAGVPQ